MSGDSGENGENSSAVTPARPMNRPMITASIMLATIIQALDGTIANAVCAEAARSAAVVRIGHPSGIMDVDIRVERDGEEYRILRAAYGRTARRIMEGYIYLKPWADDSSILSL